MNPNQIIQTRHFNKRPIWLNLLNKGWRSTYFLGTRIRLDKDDLIRTARKATGLHDLGKDFGDEPLERLIRSINEEAALHPVGLFISKQRLVGLLNTRLRAEEAFRRHPEILEQPLYPTWFIVGLQRTGTTKLQRLLAADPDHRVLASWEAINPAPWNPDDPTGDRRLSVAKTSVKALKYMAPGFFAIHPIGPSLPEEDILLLDVSFLSTTPEATMNVPSYASWLERTDQSAAYEYEVKLLKLLQWQRPAKRWILKSPHHLEFPNLIEKHFPEVHFIWTHRNVYESIPSFLSMVGYSQAIFSEEANLRTIARHWVRKTGYMLEKTIAYRRTGDEGKFTDIFYEDIVNNPLDELERLYSGDGGIRPELSDSFRHAEKENPFRKYGIHKYSLDDFGLTTEDIDSHTKNYQQFVKEIHERRTERSL
jgi:hypothetical protein